MSINLLKFIGSLAPLSSPLVLSHSYSEQVKESSSLSSALELLVVVLLRPKNLNLKINYINNLKLFQKPSFKSMRLNELFLNCLIITEMQCYLVNRSETRMK